MDLPPALGACLMASEEMGLPLSVRMTAAGLIASSGPDDHQELTAFS